MDKIPHVDPNWTEEDYARLARVFGEGYADLCRQPFEVALQEIAEFQRLYDTPDDLIWPAESGRGRWTP